MLAPRSELQGKPCLGGVLDKHQKRDYKLVVKQKKTKGQQNESGDSRGKNTETKKGIV